MSARAQYKTGCGGLNLTLSAGVAPEVDAPDQAGHRNRLRLNRP